MQLLHQGGEGRGPSTQHTVAVPGAEDPLQTGDGGATPAAIFVNPCSREQLNSNIPWEKNIKLGQRQGPTFFLNLTMEQAKQ